MNNNYFLTVVFISYCNATFGMQTTADIEVYKTLEASIAAEDFGAFFVGLDSLDLPAWLEQVYSEYVSESERVVSFENNVQREKLDIIKKLKGIESFFYSEQALVYFNQPENETHRKIGHHLSLVYLLNPEIDVHRTIGDRLFDLCVRFINVSSDTDCDNQKCGIFAI